MSGARSGQWAYRPFPAIRFRRNLAGRQMPNTTGLILASPAAVDCQPHPPLTRMRPTTWAARPRSVVTHTMAPGRRRLGPRWLAPGLVDAHLDGWRPVFPDDPCGKRRRMGRLLSSRIVPGVTLGLAVVLDADRKHVHHAPCGFGRAEATRGYRVLRETRHPTTFFRSTVAAGEARPAAAAVSIVPGPAERVAGCARGERVPAASGTKPSASEHTTARRRTSRLGGVSYSTKRNGSVPRLLDR